MTDNIQRFARMAAPATPMFNAPMGQTPAMPRLTPDQLAALGRGGDSIAAHLTPGEIEVPPQVQTPKVLATLRQAFKEKGVQPQSFVAGSPSASHNPATGLPEYSFFSNLLPLAGGIAGSLLLGPEFAGLMGASPALGTALGGGLGTLAGGIASGQPWQQALMGGVGAGAGGYLLGHLFPDSMKVGDLVGKTATGAASPAAGMAAQAAAHMPTAADAILSPGELTNGIISQTPATTAAATATGPMAALMNSSVAQGAGSALGGYLGNSLYSPQLPNNGLPRATLDDGTHMTPIDQLPNYNTLLRGNASATTAPLVPPPNIDLARYGFGPQQIFAPAV